jgi:hypothetical protein
MVLRGVSCGTMREHHRCCEGTRWCYEGCAVVLQRNSDDTTRVWDGATKQPQCFYKGYAVVLWEEPGSFVRSALQCCKGNVGGAIDGAGASSLCGDNKATRVHGRQTFPFFEKPRVVVGSTYTWREMEVCTWSMNTSMDPIPRFSGARGKWSGFLITLTTLRNC